MRKIRIATALSLDVKRMKQVGVGKRVAVKRIRPKDERFSVGNIFWLSDGIYRLEELTKPMRCNKSRYMIFRPIDLSCMDNKSMFTVYRLAGATV